MTDAPGRMLFSPQDIAGTVERLAGEIARDFAGQPLVLIGVLKGALYTTVDLARALAAVAGGPSELFVDYLCLASYGSSTRPSEQVRLLLDGSVPIRDRHVVLVDDIADYGLTLSFALSLLKERRPASLSACVLFDKPSRRRVQVPIRYLGRAVEDTFVVGYGLDYQERYRNLPYLAELENP